MLDRSSTFRCLLAGLILVFALPSAVAAQVTFEFVPYAGVYLPTQKLLDHSLYWLCNCQLSLKQKAGVARGGRLTLWWTSHLGAEVTLGYSPTGLSTVGAQPRDSSGHVITASVRVLRQISPTGGSPWLLRLGGGLGYVSRGGRAYTELSDGSPSVCGTSRFAGVVSAGTGFKFGRRLALRLDAEDYVYRSGLYVHGEDPGCGAPGQYQCRGYVQVCTFFETASPTNRFQDDLVLSVGVTLPGP